MPLNWFKSYHTDRAQVIVVGHSMTPEVSIGLGAFSRFTAVRLGSSLQGRRRGPPRPAPNFLHYKSNVRQEELITAASEIK